MEAYRWAVPDLSTLVEPVSKQGRFPTLHHGKIPLNSVSFSVENIPSEGFLPRPEVLTEATAPGTRK